MTSSIAGYEMESIKIPSPVDKKQEYGTDNSPNSYFSCCVPTSFKESNTKDS